MFSCNSKITENDLIQGIYRLHRNGSAHFLSRQVGVVFQSAECQNREEKEMKISRFRHITLDNFFELSKTTLPF